MDPIRSVAKEFGLKVVEDACQAHGAEYGGCKAGSLGDYAAFSFYPSKNIGAYGDGGAVVTRSAEEAAKLKMLRNYGQKKRYYHSIKGFNSRLDELQAAILTVKLQYLDAWNARRREIAEYYVRHIKNPEVSTPREMSYGRHVFHLFVIRHQRRDALAGYLKENGVHTVIHYPVPIHLQEAYADLGYSPGSIPVAEDYAKQIVSLPIFPQLRDKEVERVAELVNSFADGHQCLCSAADKAGSASRPA
jgi:dTDP-4-amino-4,6-dideoxygalactose transaminase